MASSVPHYFWDMSASSQLAESPLREQRDINTSLGSRAGSSEESSASDSSMHIPDTKGVNAHYLFTNSWVETSDHQAAKKDSLSRVRVLREEIENSPRMKAREKLECDLWKISDSVRSASDSSDCAVFEFSGSLHGSSDHSGMSNKSFGSKHRRASIHAGTNEFEISRSCNSMEKGSSRQRRKSMGGAALKLERSILMREGLEMGSQSQHGKSSEKITSKHPVDLERKGKVLKLNRRRAATYDSAIEVADSPPSIPDTKELIQKLYSTFEDIQEGERKKKGEAFPDAGIKSSKKEKQSSKKDHRRKRDRLRKKDKSIRQNQNSRSELVDGKEVANNQESDPEKATIRKEGEDSLSETPLLKKSEVKPNLSPTEASSGPSSTPDSEGNRLSRFLESTSKQLPRDDALAKMKELQQGVSGRVTETTVSTGHSNSVDTPPGFDLLMPPSFEDLSNDADTVAESTVTSAAVSVILQFEPEQDGHINRVRPDRSKGAWVSIEDPAGIHCEGHITEMPQEEIPEEMEEAITLPARPKIARRFSTSGSNYARCTDSRSAQRSDDSRGMTRGKSIHNMLKGVLRRHKSTNVHDLADFPALMENTSDGLSSREGSRHSPLSGSHHSTHDTALSQNPSVDFHAFSSLGEPRSASSHRPRRRQSM